MAHLIFHRNHTATNHAEMGDIVMTAITEMMTMKLIFTRMIQDPATPMNLPHRGRIARIPLAPDLPTMTIHTPLQNTLEDAKNPLD